MATTVLGNMIAAYRQKFDLSLKELASATGISQPVLSKIMNGKGTHDANTLVKIINWMAKKDER